MKRKKREKGGFFHIDAGAKRLKKKNYGEETGNSNPNNTMMQRISNSCRREIKIRNAEFKRKVPINLPPSEFTSL
jgi:hypothetical protein